MKFTRKYENLTMDDAVDVTIYAIVGGVTGARLIYVFLNIKHFISTPLHIFYIREGGLSWHGGLLGGFLGLVVLHFVRKIPLGKICDFGAVHITIGLAIGRIGCFLNGCCYGKVTHVPWAIEFKGAVIPGLRHPTQLYESFLLVIAFLFLLWWWKRKKFDGEMTMMMLALYGIIRFVVEIFRYNTPNQYLFGGSLSLAQYFSILLTIIFGTIIFIKRRKKQDKAVDKT